MRFIAFDVWEQSENNEIFLNSPTTKDLHLFFPARHIGVIAQDNATDIHSGPIYRVTQPSPDQFLTPTASTPPPIDCKSLS
jgi:hypothetical protein